jgi:hypothetical protein
MPRYCNFRSGLSRYAYKRAILLQKSCCPIIHHITCDRVKGAAHPTRTCTASVPSPFLSSSKSVLKSAQPSRGKLLQSRLDRNIPHNLSRLATHATAYAAVRRILKTHHTLTRYQEIHREATPEKLYKLNRRSHAVSLPHPERAPVQYQGVVKAHNFCTAMFHRQQQQQRPIASQRRRRPLPPEVHA